MYLQHCRSVAHQCIGELHSGNITAMFQRNKERICNIAVRLHIDTLESYIVGTL